MSIREAFIKHTDKDAPIYYVQHKPIQSLTERVGCVVEYITDKDYEGTVLDKIKNSK